MASPDTKNDILLGGFSKLRISGITVIPGPSQMALALRRLELSMAELHDIWNISLPYNFEEDPDFGSPHNLPKGLIDAAETYLAVSLLTDFGKISTPSLGMRIKGAMSALFKFSAKASTPRVGYPSRMPIGKRISSVYPNDKFFPEQVSVPVSSSVIVMYIGDRREFIETFLTELDGTEIISVLAITADSELTINSSSFSDTAVTFDITATGSSDGSASTPQVKIVITTDASKIITRIINFKLLNSEI